MKTCATCQYHRNDECEGLPSRHIDVRVADDHGLNVSFKPPLTFGCTGWAGRTEKTDGTITGRFSAVGMVAARATDLLLTAKLGTHQEYLRRACPRIVEALKNHPQMSQYLHSEDPNSPRIRAIAEAAYEELTRG